MKARTKTDMPIKKLILAASSAQSSLEKSATIQNIFIKSQKVSTTAIRIETIPRSKKKKIATANEKEIKEPEESA